MGVWSEERIKFICLLFECLFNGYFCVLIFISMIKMIYIDEFCILFK